MLSAPGSGAYDPAFPARAVSDERYTARPAPSHRLRRTADLVAVDKIAMKTLRQRASAIAIQTNEHSLCAELQMCARCTLVAHAIEREARHFAEVASESAAKVDKLAKEPRAWPDVHEMRTT